MHSLLTLPVTREYISPEVLSSDSLCCQGLHLTSCAAEFNDYILQVITGPIGGHHKRTAREAGRIKADGLGTREIGRTYSLHRC